jgi:hypothetical protein
LKRSEFLKKAIALVEEALVLREASLAQLIPVTVRVEVLKGMGDSAKVDKNIIG